MNFGFRMPGFEAKLHLLIRVYPGHIISSFTKWQLIINTCLLELFWTLNKIIYMELLLKSGSWQTPNNVSEYYSNHLYT